VITGGMKVKPGQEGVTNIVAIELDSSSIVTRLLITLLGIGLTYPTKILRP
jgi:hypothetical protein